MKWGMWISQNGVCSKYIKQANDWLTRLVQKYDDGKTKCSLEKDSNLLKQKHMTQETAANKIKNQLKSSNENDKIEELKGKQYMDNCTGTLKDHQ